ncbi:unnamed protein product, partial [Durusdinium trenchii]
AGSCRESMNESRSSVEAMFQSKLGESGRLERRSCVDVLQSLGLTFQEANTLLKEYSEDSWICVKDFLDVLFAPPEVQKAEESMQERNQPGASTALEVHKAETSVKEGSDVKKPSTSEAHLGKYFQKDYKNGGAFKNEEYEFDPDDWCWVHKGLKIKVWADALDLTQAGGDGDVECYFHYTTELGFRNITHASKAAVEVFASLITSGEKANAWWGRGVYSVRKAPDEWPSVETILDNNYRNMLKRDIDLKGREAAIQDYRSRVAFCIPILVNASIAYDVSERPTPEMVEQGKPAGVNLAGKLLNEAGKPLRECIVVRAQGESDIGNARAVLVETLRCRAEAVVTRRGTTHWLALQSLSRLASVLENRGNLAEAEALRRRVLKAYEAKWGAKHRETLKALNNLAGVLEDQGKFEEAEPLYRRDLEGSETQLGARHPDTLISLNNLANLLQVQGKYEEAEPLYRRALEGYEAQLGAKHPETLTSLNNLALLLKKQGKFEEAEPLQRRVLEVKEAQLGARHPRTLISANNLGVLLLDRRKLDESEVFLHRAVEGREAQLGSQHPHTLRSVYHLARLSAAQGRLEEAQSHFRRAMEGQVAQLGVRHQETLDSIFGLAKLLEAKGFMVEAQELYHRQLDALEARRRGDLMVSDAHSKRVGLRSCTAQTIQRPASAVNTWNTCSVEAKRQDPPAEAKPALTVSPNTCSLVQEDRREYGFRRELVVRNAMHATASAALLELQLQQRSEVMGSGSSAQAAQAQEATDFTGLTEAAGAADALARGPGLAGASGGRIAGRSLESMAELRGQVEAIFEASCRHGECHDGDGETWLERQGCMEILQDLGDRLQEAHAHLQEYPEDSRIRVKDFLDILFAAEVHKAETSVKEGSDVKKASTSEAHLRNYFQKDYKNGGAFDHEEYDFDVGDWCWVHKGLKIKVWADALDLTQAGGDGDVECYFHYTTELGFRNITHASKAAVEVFASLITSGEKANAWWGKGVYSVRKAPDEWPSVETILDNNYRNMLKRDIDLKGREAAIQDYQSRVEFCIPILVNASIAYDVSKRPTPEMLEQGKPAGVNLAGKLLNEAGKPPRECIVVRAQGESDIGNARAVLVETLRCRAEAAVARLGPTDGYALQAMSRLAFVLRKRGDLAEAEALRRRILDAYQAQWGAEHRQTLTALNNLAGVLEDQGKFEEAEPLHRRALEGREARLGARHPETFTSANNLALLLEKQGKFKEAEPLQRRVLEGREAQLGARHLDTLVSLNNLASLLWRQGKFEEAEPLYRKALEGREAQLGARHPDTLSSLNNLAALLFAQGKLEEAEPLFRRQLEGIEAQLGASHPNTLTFANNLGVLLLDRRKLDESEVFLHRAVEGREAQLGSQHPHTLRSVYHLARLSAAQGRLEEAQSHFRRAMEGQVAQLGVRHQETLDSISGLAKLLEAKGSMEEAHELYQRQLDALEELHGSDHPKTRACREHLEHLQRGDKRQEDPPAEAMMPPDSADQ